MEQSLGPESKHLHQTILTCPPVGPPLFLHPHTVGTNVQVRAVYGNFNEEAGITNPFKMDLSAAPPHMASRVWVHGVLLQALMLTLWLQHWR